MRLKTRIWLVSALACSIAAVSSPLAYAEFGVKRWEAGTCKVTSCKDAGTKQEEEFFTQAAGHPNFGITDFEMNYKEALGAKQPEGHIQDVRVDLPPGLSVNPEATEACTEAQLNESKCPSESKVGEDEATGTVNVPETILAGILKVPVGALTVTEKFPVYNMVRKYGQPARFGVEVKSSTLSVLGISAILYLEGGISWYHEPPAAGEESSNVPSGDYHEFFKIDGIPTTPEIIESKLIFWGIPQEHTGVGSPKAFITLPSTCTERPITYLHVDSHENSGHFLLYENQTPITARGCGSLAFNPSISQKPETTQSDAPDGTEVVLHIPQATNEPSKENSPDLQTAQVTLPEGMTLNPSAANGLEACTNEEIGIGTNRPIGCPAKSVVGSVSVEAPGIPSGSLAGNIYLGIPESQEPSSGREYRIFIAAETPQYGVGIRLEGRASANPTTGRLTTTVSGGPQVPFENFKLKFNGTATTPLANPLVCGAATTTAALTPYTGGATTNPFSPFTVDLNGKGGACPSPLPFTLTQGAASTPNTGGANTSFAFGLARADGQQYLSKLSTTLPEGLVGRIPAVTLCGEPQAATGDCGSASQIGTVSVSVGSGASPYSLPGTAYLTGPYAGAPYGLSVVVPAEKVGPFNYGKIVTRATIAVNPFTSQITVASQLPTIVGGVPLRLKTLSVNVNRPNFTINPTNCGALATTTALTSTLGTTQSLSTPFQATNCGALAFAPKFTASSNAKTSRADGAALNVKVTFPAGAQANIKSVLVALPKILPSRTSTLHNACPEAMFNANPFGCPQSRVGEATVTTPVLPGKLTGYALFVSHGGAAFPDLDLVLSGDGVTVILVGNTNIQKNITTSDFASLPDVPISSFETRLPMGKNSVVTATGNVCKRSLTMPTTITAQNGKAIKQNTKISVSGCPVEILSHKVRGGKAIIVVKVPAAGRITASGKDLRTVHKHPGKARDVKLEIPLKSSARGALAVHHKLKLRVRIGFVPKAKGPSSSASVKVTFK
jgi:hypothetical protein